jgi:rhamnosyltransferase
MEEKLVSMKYMIAVLLAAYNGEKWIEQQIKTILSQKGVNLHLYISVDLSTDNTYRIVSELSQKYSEITILSYGRRFGGAAPNFYRLFFEVPIEKYDYIALSDQDDIWMEEKLINAIKVLEKENAYGYSSDFIAFWETGQRKYIKKSHPQVAYDFLFEAPGPGCTFVLKNDLIVSIKLLFKNKMHLLNEIDCHDWFIYAYARIKKYKWVIDNNHFIEYRQHDSNQLGVNNGFHAFFYRANKLIDGYGVAQAVKIIKLLEIDQYPFIKNWFRVNKIHYLKLALISNKLRRKKRDRVLMFLLCVFSSFKELVLEKNK